ncbi:MAG: hypothetical protein EAZ75_10090 [Flavobacteriia bacterium]|nr:MAG: hypothetical protein EAZ75_10090 [Flavobacteriia bacterium]
MPTGIYIAGLGQSTTKESVEKYAARYIKELEYCTSGINYYTKVEKIYYNEDQSSLAVRIFQHPKEQPKSEKDTLLYSFYDFEYNELLNQKFQNKNLLFKNIALLLLVIRKFPRIIASLFKKTTYTKGGQTFYMFIMFLIMAIAVLFLLPSMLSLINEIEFFKIHNLKINLDWFSELSKFTIPITTFLILFIPESNTLLTKVAAEFTTIDNYIQYGEQSQIIQGNFDALVEYIVENEENPTVHLHTYSFGSIIALDALFPIGTEPCNNILNNIKLLITVGAPYEFIDSYYPNFYSGRTDKMCQQIEWINVYSTLDAFASNFRKDNKSGKAQFGIKGKKEVPINLNYEIARKEKCNVFSFLTLKHITMHQSYWDDSKSGQSCTRLIFNKMKEKQYWN